MTKYDKMEYMIKSIEVALEEYERIAIQEMGAPDLVTENKEWREYMKKHRSLNKSLIRDNLKNVGRMAFAIAKEI